jgi:aminocarboxymuconate-semialdehyde decarboxylase
MKIERMAPLGRRAFLAALGSGAGAAAMTGASLAASAQAAGAENSDGKGVAPLKIIDFHNHYVGPAFRLTTLNGAPPALRSYWEGVNRNLADPGALMASIEEGATAARVINTPTAFLEDADGNVPPGTVERINDQIRSGRARRAGLHPSSHRFRPASTFRTLRPAGSEAGARHHQFGGAGRAARARHLR